MEVFLIRPITPIPNLFYIGKETIFSYQKSQCFALSQFCAGCCLLKSSLRLQTWILHPISLHSDKIVQGVPEWHTRYRAEAFCLCFEKDSGSFGMGGSNPTIKWDIFRQEHEIETPCTCVEPSGTGAAAGTRRGSQLSSPELPTCSKKETSQALPSQQEFCVPWGRENRTRNLRGKPKTGN